MKKLTNKEKEIMDLYWQYGPMFVRELQEHYDDPKPHFNTLSTIVRILEREGFLDHKQFGNTYQYYPLISEAEYGRKSMQVSSRTTSTTPTSLPSPRLSRKRRSAWRNCANSSNRLRIAANRKS